MRRSLHLRIVLAWLISLCLAVPIIPVLPAPPPAVVPTVRTEAARTHRLPASPAGQWYLQRIGAQVAWSLGATGYNAKTGKPVKILVIDTGLDAAAAALTGIATLPSWSAWRGVSPHQDAIGHGSFVAEELAAAGTALISNTTYMGVCPRCQVAMARVFGSTDGASDSDIARAYLWGVNHGYTVISMSLGGPYPSDAMRAAVAYGASKGVVCVAAAGNDGEDAPSYPGSYPGCLRVAATDSGDRVADFSNSGPDMGIAAPGVGILGYVAPGTTLAAYGAGWQEWDGTSMAAPLVAGAIADLMSLGLSTKVAEAALLAGARWTPGQDRDHYGAGILSLVGALQQLGYLPSGQ